MYDKQGNVLSIAYPDHSIVAYIYDAGGRISSITRKANNSSPSVAVINTVTYAPHGQIATMNFANGLTQIHTYNQNKNYQLINKRAGVFQNIIYGYDALGNILTLTDNSITSTKKTATYTYDDLNRLKTASISNVASGQAPYAETYTYNPVGNILSKTGINYSYSGLNYTNPHAPTSIGASTLIYDNSGNLLSDGVKGNIWNYKNQLSSSSIDRNVYYYFYDHTGERMKEMAPKSTTYTPFNNYVSSAAKKTKNIYLGSILVATVDNTVESASSTVSYILTDHLGSTEKVTNQAGQLVETYDYLPFGKERITSNQSKRRYIGEIYDSTTGYNYLNARYYDSSRGQFISQDSMFWEIGKTGNPENVLRDPQQMNSYSYASNNPIMHSDPTGRCVDGISTIACIVAWSAISSIVAGHGLILYGAITENTQAIEGGFALNEIGTAGGGGLVYTQTQANNLNNKIETSVPSVTIKKSGEVIKTTSNIPDEALVVRGGGLTNQTPVKFNITESRIPGITGFSVQCKVSCVNIEQLNQLGRYLRNNELSVTTAKTIRQNGGNIVITPGLGEHATVTNLDGNQASQIPWKGFTNPKK